MVDLIVMKTKGKDAPVMEQAVPAPEKLISGTAKTKTWNHFTGEDERLYCGIWQSGKGKVKVSYDEWEFCHIISGEAELTNEDGKSWRFRKGDAFIIPAGFKGTWETKKKVRKHYVILLPKG